MDSKETIRRLRGVTENDVVQGPADAFVAIGQEPGLSIESKSAVMFPQSDHGLAAPFGFM